MNPTITRILVSALALVTIMATAADFHVAPDGNNTNPGTASRPFASLEKARDTVRALKSGGNLPKGPVTVWIGGGTYWRNRSFELTAADSGTSESPVIYRSKPGEQVRLIGGKNVQAFKPVEDPAVRKRLPEAARNSVLVADLAAQGLTAPAPLRSRGFNRNISPAHMELFFDGKPMTLARWPNEGEWEKIAGFPPAAGKEDSHGGEMGDLQAGFYYAGDRPKNWDPSSDIWANGYWAWDWAYSYERIESIDLAQGLIKTAPPYGLYGFKKGQRFQFLNVLEELDQPGEYFADAKANRLYFWPPKAINDSEVLVSVLDTPLVSMRDASHITLRGLVLEATRGMGVAIRGGTGDRIEGCLLRLIGNHAVTIEGGQQHIVTDCDIENTGDGGVIMKGGDRKTLTPGGHVVDNCHFQKQGRWSKCYVPAIGMDGVGLRSTHNLIHDHPHCAILFHGNDHLMEFNEIHRYALETGDVGAIYTGADYTFRGNVVRYNYLHHAGGLGKEGSMGVYMDDCVSGTTIFGNIFYKCNRAVFLGGGRDHRVENNLFVECTPGLRADGRGLDTRPVWRRLLTERMSKSLREVPLDLYRERYPAMKSLDLYYGRPDEPALKGDAIKGIPPEGNLIARNVCVGKWLDITWHAKPDKPEWFEIRDNTVLSDLGLGDAAKRDFRLKDDSPAWKTGFKPIPFEKMGLRKDPLRTGCNVESRKPLFMNPSIHALSAEDNKNATYHNAGVKVKPYDISTMNPDIIRTIPCL